ncbi:hypothetical protein Cgig2_004932 [Carnegiea gigantea]|uniref:Uncharacterized protein n=1 Tax=Carnegiea gigantea TaxID=171969 RepID=A0A9Q1QT53_9CARY|nr:hypothetical protein Cgig2_004932 [Carnegiea gigantea]
MLKRLDYGFNGYQVPFIPRAARSARRRGPVQKKAEDIKMCAFDVLATVAGKLLLEGEALHTNSGKDQVLKAEDVVMGELHCEGNAPKSDHCGNLEMPPSSLELGLQVAGGHSALKEDTSPQHDVSLAPDPVITLANCLQKYTSLSGTALHGDKSELCNHPEKSDGLSPVRIDASVEQLGRGELLLGNGHMCDSDDAKFPGEKSPALASMDGSIQHALGKEQCPYASCSPSKGNNIEIVSRYDDENSSGCTQPSTMKNTRSPARIGDRRIRKLFASKYWRVSPKVKDGDFSDTELRCVYRSRKNGYKRQKSQKIYPFKKRKFFRCSSLSSCDGVIGCKGAYNSSDMSSGKSSTCFGAVGHGVNGSSSFVAGQSTPFPSGKSHAKLRIKSFRVPELFIDMPETATIGSLKRTVMETITALLGGGLRVGVLLQGRKIRDDSRTLLQLGICHEGKVQSLGFTLEPSPSYADPCVFSEDNSCLPSADALEPTRCPPASTIHQGSFQLSADHLVAHGSSLIESDHDSTPFPSEMSVEKGTVDSKALVALPEEPPQALSIVPAHQISKQSEIAQRRIRRPFSVAEVEALVQAVEKLGTGRWRDVKLRAFDNVKHRTYVDLKDKWKTLVHTARISPQQRRGEPVPQELLERVLTAHAYWSQHQAKQQLKQQSDPCRLL